MVQLLRNSIGRISQGWFEHFGQSSVSTPTWSLDRDLLSKCEVHWPTRYQWPPSAAFLDSVRLGIAAWAKVERRPIPQPYNGIGIFEVAVNGREHRVAVDYSDYVDRIDRECVAGVSLYFKMQCLKDGYELTSEERGKVFPGGYVTADRRLTPRLAGIRAAARQATQRFNVYGRFGLDFAREIRTAVVERLRREPSLAYEGGMKKVPLRQSLLEAARSKICIDLPGNGDFCFRLLDYLSVGAFVIAYPHRTRLLSPLIDKQHLVYINPDLSDLVPLCQYYLEHDEERRKIQDNATHYFDKYCSYMQIGSWYLHQCLKLS